MRIGKHCAPGAHASGPGWSRNRAMRAILVIAAMVGVTAFPPGAASMQQPSRQLIKAGPDLGLPFSPAVKAGGLIYVSGMLATDAQAKLVPGDVRRRRGAYWTI